MFAAINGLLLRADRALAWRRAGAGAGNARCDRHSRRLKPWVDAALVLRTADGFGHTAS